MCHVPTRPDQVRGIRVDASTSLGVCWARSRIQTELWKDEEYYLQIDIFAGGYPRFGHQGLCPWTHFIWDQKLISR
ncbi:hypothetical protein WCLP8_1890001 [uncultured Gammaproteobacteria bacterium]